MDYADELKVAKRAALEAGKLVLKNYGDGSRKFSTKEDRSPLTEADLLANDAILSALTKTFPEYPILTEEGADDKERVKNKLVWIVDPLDGTKEFIAGIGEFTVNIALVSERKPVLGVVFSPVEDELFYAVKGQGAYLEKNSSKKGIRVSKKNKIENMVLVKSRFHSNEKVERLIKSHKFQKVKTYGSSIKGCRLAEGKADVYFRLGPINEWDICAMNAVLDGAGGIMTDFNGRELEYNSENTLIEGFVASNNTIHKKLCSIARG